MKQDWDVEDIITHFTLLPEEVSFLGSNDPHNHLGKALLLKFFQHEGRFPESAAELPPAIIDYVAQQLSLPPAVIQAYQWAGRTIKAHRRQVREWLGFRPATVADQQALQTWLREVVLPHEHRPVYLAQLAYQRLRQLHLEPPTQGRLERLVASALWVVVGNLIIAPSGPSTNLAINLLSNLGPVLLLVAVGYLGSRIWSERAPA